MLKHVEQYVFMLQHVEQHVFMLNMLKICFNAFLSNFYRDMLLQHVLRWPYGHPVRPDLAPFIFSGTRYSP